MNDPLHFTKVIYDLSSIIVTFTFTDADLENSGKTAHTAVTIAPTENVTMMNPGVTVMLGITESYAVTV